MNRRQLLLLAFASVAAAHPARAADWPERPVTLVNPFAAGGGVDVLLRGIAKVLSDKFGQSFIVENRTGAGGTVASLSVAKAAPDGYTLLMTAVGPAVLNQLLFKSVPYDTDRDFTPVIMLGEIPQLIVSNPQLGFKTLGDLVDYGRKNPGKLSIGHSGAGTMGNLTGAVFLARTGIQGTLIGYRGVTLLVTDILGGQIQAGAPAYFPGLQNVTMLAVASAQRVPFLPNVPTARESGVDLIASTWIAMVAPAKTPQNVVSKLNLAINAYMATREGQQLFEKVGLSPLGGTPDYLAEVIKRDRVTWGLVIEKENIKLDPN